MLTPGWPAATVGESKRGFVSLEDAGLKHCRGFGWVVAASAILVPNTPALADDGGVVGWVESTRGVPLAGAVISIFGKSIHGNRVTLSDGEGQFVLPALPPGLYTLRAVSTGHEPSAARRVTVLPDRDALFTVSLAPIGEEAVRTSADPAPQSDKSLREWLWLMRHKRRSVLESTGEERDVASKGAVELQPPRPASLADLPLAGSVELAATSGPTLPVDSLGAVHLKGRLTDGVLWTLAGLGAENEGRAWRMAAQFVIDPGGGHEIEAGAGYGAGDSRISASEETVQAERTMGAAFLRSRWRLSERVHASAGGRYTYLGFLSNSHHADAVVEIEVEGSPGTLVRGSVSTRSLVPGGDLLTLSTVTASPAITWARLEDGLQAARTMRYEIDADRSLGASRVGAQLFDESMTDVLVTTFQDGLPILVNSGRTGARGVAVTFGHRFGSLVDGSLTYAYGRSRHTGLSATDAPAVAFEQAAFHDVTARVETKIDGTDTRLAAVYRLNTTSDEAGATPPRAKGIASRFDVQLTQGLPFLQPLTRADWELLFAVRNMFYEASQAGFLDELAVQEPPTRVVGGISVRF